MGQLCLFIAIVNIFVLVVHPEERDLVIDEIDSKMIENEDLLQRHSVVVSKEESVAIVSRNYETMGKSFK